MKRLYGFVIFFLGIALIISYFSYSNLDPYYGFKTTSEVNNLLGVWGAYLSGTLINYLGFSSYLILIFCTVWGFKLIFGHNIKYKILRFITLIFSILIISSVYVQLDFYENIIGKLIYQNLLILLFNKIENYYFLLLIKLIIAVPLVLMIFFSLGVDNKYIKGFFKVLINMLGFILKLIVRFFKFLFKPKKKRIKKITERKEPSIITNSNKFFSKKIEPKISLRKQVYEKNTNQGSLNFDKSIKYELPKLNLLKNLSAKDKYVEESDKVLDSNARQLEEVLGEFGIQGNITDVRPGPIVTLYELEPSAGTKASRIINLSDDIARSMSALSARISSHPGRNIIGIELSNKKRRPVFLSELLSHENYTTNDKNLLLALGKDIAGTPVTADLEKMPHLLIAGTTGSGKSVGINSMIISLLFKLKPSECRFILIDPKMLELSIYEDIPHLMAPVVTNPHKAIVALKWAVREMENRYRLMNHTGVKNVLSYNERIKQLIQRGEKIYREVTTGIDPDTNLPIIEKQEIPNETFPYIVIVIDEMADLMMVAGKDVELAIQRLAQMARAAGIHLIMATQRPSVDVITGTIKANFPSRISYHVASKFDSRTILNEMGAEQLLGSGDMLFMENAGKIKRLHGGFISEKEIHDVVNFIKNQSRPDYSTDITSEENLVSKNFEINQNNELVDELYNDAVRLVVFEQKASTSFIQRHLQIGYNRAARIVEKMEKDKLISEANHVGKREVLKKSEQI